MLKTNGISDIRLPEFPNHLFNKHSLHAKCDKALCLPFYSWEVFGTYVGLGGTVVWGRLLIYLMLELGLKENNICKVTVYSNFVVFLREKKLLSIVPSAILLSVEGGR